MRESAPGQLLETACLLPTTWRSYGLPPCVIVGPLVTTGRLTVSGLLTAGVGVDIRADGTKSDSPAGQGRPVEPGNYTIGSYNSVFYCHVRMNNFRTPIFTTRLLKRLGTRWQGYQRRKKLCQNLSNFVLPFDSYWRVNLSCRSTQVPVHELKCYC